MEKLTFYINNITFDIVTSENVFGDGSHETTQMMLKVLSKYDLQNKTIADVGTGNGILATFAALSGAKNVIGIDIEEEAVALANENFQLNNINNATAIRNNLLQGIINPQDIILANLGPSEQLQNLSTAKNFLNENGILIISWYNALPLNHFVNEKDFEIIEHLNGFQYDVYVLKVK